VNWDNGEKGMMDYINAAFENIAICENFGWFVDLNYNILFKMNMTTGKISSVCALPYSNYQKNQYTRVTLCNKNLVLVPHNADKIIIYCIDKEQLIELPLERKYSDNGMLMNFSDAFVFENNIFFIPARYHAMARLDIDSNHIEYFTEGIDMILSDKSINVNRNILSGNYLFSDDCLYLPLWQRGKVLAVEIDSLNCSMIDFDDDEKGFSSICGTSDNLIISSKDSMTFYMMNKEDAVVQKYDLDKIQHGSVFGAAAIINSKGGYLIIPSKGVNIIWVDKNFENMKIVYKKDFTYLNDSEKYALNDYSYNGYTLSDEKMYVFSWRESELLVIDLSNYSIDKYSTKVEVNDCFLERNVMVRSHFSGKIVRENRNINLNYLIESL